MPSVVPSSVADAKLAEKAAWRRYAEAKGDNWPEAFAEWVEARDALLAAYADEAANLLIGTPPAWKGRQRPTAVDRSLCRGSSSQV